MNTKYTQPEQQQSDFDTWSNILGIMSHMTSHIEACG